MTTFIRQRLLENAARLLLVFRVKTVAKFESLCDVRRTGRESDEAGRSASDQLHQLVTNHLLQRGSGLNRGRVLIRDLCAESSTTLRQLFLWIAELV